MTTKLTPRLIRGLAAASAVSMLALTTSAYAQPSLTWLGGNNTNTSWGAGGQFSGAFVSSNTTDLTFDSLTNATNNVTGGNRTVRSITFGDAIDSAWTTNMSTSSVLTFSAATGNASFNVNAGATGNITFNGGVGFTGSQSLTSNLEINHNGSGLLLWNRQTAGAGGFIKNGTGTFIIAAPNNNSFTGAVNVNAGRLVMGSTSGATGDFNTSSGINLGGGVLELRTSSALNKSISQNMTVSAASTLAYNNTTNTTQSLTIQTGSMVLDAALTVQNISANTTLVNNINITRNMTGTGDLIVDTYNNVADGAVAFSNGRVQLSGDNTAWGGDLIIAKGTAQYSGANSLGGSGSITIGTTGDAFGAALGFNTGNTSQTLSKAITVTTGGIRLIRNNSGPGTAADLTLSGPINLEGDLTVDHAGLGAGNSITLSGGLSGAGGLNVTFVGPHPITDSSVRLTGTNTYLGETAVSSGTLILGTGTTLASTSIRVATAGTLNVSALTALTIASGNRIGGDGTVTGNLALDAGARFVFSMTSTLDVTGTVTLDNSFSVASLVNGDGTAIDWSVVSDGSYTLIGIPGGDFSNISNFGSGNLGSLGAGKSGYFENAAGLSGLGFVVVPEPQVWVLFAIGLASVFFFRLRRRSA